MKTTARFLNRISDFVETKAIQAHLDAVLAELEQRDLWGLLPSQRKARREVITRLREYRDRGVFPKNYFSATRAPYLRDPHGVSCAVAYLLEESGRKDIVESLVALDNGIYMEDAKYPELLDWLEASGLTHEEACRIQVVYAPDPSMVQHLRSFDPTAPVKVFQKVAPHFVNAPPAPDYTFLYMAITITTGAAIWLAYRWFNRTPRLKEVRPAMLPPLEKGRVGERLAVKEAARERELVA